MEEGHGGVAAVDADDRSAGMGAGSAKIDAGHGGAGGEAVGPHVGGQALALKDVAAGEADFLLDVGRAEDLDVEDGGVDVGAEAGERGEREMADFVAAGVPTCRGRNGRGRIGRRRSWCGGREGRRRGRGRFGSRVRTRGERAGRRGARRRKRISIRLW